MLGGEQWPVTGLLVVTVGQPVPPSPVCSPLSVATFCHSQQLSVKNLFTGCLDLFDTFEFPLTADWIFWSTLPAQLILTGHLTGEWGGEGSGEDRGEEQEKEMFTTLSRSQERVSLLLAQSALSVWR